MSIVIRSPLNPEARVRYVGAPVAAQIVSELNPERENVLPAAFTPWLIAPSAVRAPSIFTGSLTQELAGYQVLVEGPTLTGPRLHVFEAGLDRPAESGGSLKNRSPEPCLGVTLLSKQLID
jgi:hypothetical protein